MNGELRCLSLYFSDAQLFAEKCLVIENRNAQKNAFFAEIVIFKNNS